MKLFIFFDLFLVLFTFYAIFGYEGEGKVLVFLMCLVTAFILEKARWKRRFIRYATRLKAQYSLKEKEIDMKECTVIVIARKGMGIELHSQDKLDIGSTVYFKIIVPQESEAVMVTGEIRWIKQRKNNSACGIEFTEVLDKATFKKFRSARKIKREERQPQRGDAVATG
jgi:Tfp pilus assembly protein PilZ